MTSVGADPDHGSGTAIGDFEDAYGQRDPTIVVYGLGKIGTPLAAIMAEEFGSVIGVDIDESVVDSIERGECHVEGEPGLVPLVERVVDDGALTATTDGPAASASARIHVVVVPTVLTDDGDPDLAALEAALGDIASGMDADDLVVVESTLPPGTSEDVVHPNLVAESGLEPDAVNVAFCPERTASGRAIADIRGAYPKVVGGVTPEAGVLASHLYERMTHNEVVEVTDARTAEAVKVFEGVYRDVNIALANELARSTEELGIDVNEAIRAANSQPYCDLHTPGAGVGGHCIPVYPYFLTEGVDSEFPLIETARSVNDRMPFFVVDTVVRMLERRGVDPGAASVLLLGVTYRARVAETRNAPAREIAPQLSRVGVDVDAVDPVVDVTSVDGLDANAISLSNLEGDPPDYDAVVVATAHPEFAELGEKLFEGTVLVDGRQQFEDDVPTEAHVVGSGVVR